MTEDQCAPLPVLALPPEVNYVGIFLTLDCNLNCAYCINDPDQQGCRKTLYAGTTAMPPEHWVRALNRFEVRDDLPLTLQGGEPMLYWQGRGVGEILAGTGHYFDLLTNLVIKSERMIETLTPHAARFQRPVPYPSIRVSYHPAEHQRAWGGDALRVLAGRCQALTAAGLRVSADKPATDVGIYMVAHPDNRGDPAEADGVHFETKEFLGMHDGQLYGHYKYPYSTNLLAGGFSDQPFGCRCRTSEILLDPLGFVWSCHYHLYSTWTAGGPTTQYQRAEACGFRWKATEGTSEVSGLVGHILDPDFTIADIRQFRACGTYGLCIGCDTKAKNDRFQSLYDRSKAHTSVEIQDISGPASIIDALPERDQLALFLAKS